MVSDSKGMRHKSKAIPRIAPSKTEPRRAHTATGCGLVGLWITWGIRKDGVTDCGALTSIGFHWETPLFIIATVSQGLGTSPHHRDKRGTQRPVFCSIGDAWAGTASASWLWWAQESPPVINLHKTLSTHLYRCMWNCWNWNIVGGVCPCYFPSGDTAQ